MALVFAALVLLALVLVLKVRRDMREQARMTAEAQAAWDKINAEAAEEAVPAPKPAPVAPKHRETTDELINRVFGGRQAP